MEAIKNKNLQYFVGNRGNKNENTLISLSPTQFSAYVFCLYDIKFKDLYIILKKRVGLVLAVIVIQCKVIRFNY